MGTSLNGLTPSTTYPALLKTSDNTALSATAKTISDGSGNDSALSLSTSLVGIGTITPLSQLEIKGNTDGTFRISGISGTSSSRRALFTFNNAPDIFEIDVSSALRIKNGSNYSIYANSSGNVGLGTLSPTARTHIVGSGSTSATASFLVQNSSNTQLLKVRDDNRIELSNSTYMNPLSPGGTAVNIQGGPWNGTVGLLVDSTANPIIAQSNLGASSSNPNGASIYAAGGASATPGMKSIGILSNRAIISSGNAYVMDDSAMLEVLSTTQGLLFPRMTSVQKNAIVAPAAGLAVYDTTLNKLCVRTAGAWETITSI